MSHYMTAIAMRQAGLKPAAKIVLYWLADHHNSETGMCFPSLKTLADECEMDVATVKRHLVSLEDLGLIERTRRHRENGSQTSTQYIHAACWNP
jgi:DNA-binding MarR family transcriptional regulator